MASRSRSRSSSTEDRRRRREKRRRRSRERSRSRSRERRPERDDRGSAEGSGRRRRHDEDGRARSADGARRHRRDDKRGRERSRSREARRGDQERGGRGREDGRARGRSDGAAAGPRVEDIKREEEAAAGAAEAPPQEEKLGPDFAVSGKLLEDTNVFNGVVVKYSEPPEARKCKKRWRFYVFKGDEVTATLHMHRQSAYLIGKDRKVADLPVDHPSCSRQHAAFQYRAVKGRGVVPYLMDLGSSNGTYLNNSRIEPQRYYELREKDMIKFGYSSREYVLLHENSRDEGADVDDGEGDA